MYDFLLLIISKLPPILHLFRDITFDRSKIAVWLPLLHAFNLQDGGVPYVMSSKVIYR